MAWNRLPVECLQLILDQLAEDKDIYSLNAILRVNKHLCHITLPYLYENPFSLAASKFDDDHDSISRTTINKLLVPLIRTLLASANPDHVTELLRNAYWENEEQETNSFNNKSGIDYIRYLQHFYPTSVNHALFHNWKSLKENTRLVKYIRDKDLEKQYRAQELAIENNPYEDSTAFVTRYIAIPLRAQLTWALCFPILGHMQSLTIPLSDLGRYQEEIHRLRSLQRINFKMDQKLDFSGFVTGQLRQDNPTLLAKHRQLKVDLMENMVEFVRDHTLRFPHVLLEADCPQENTWMGAHQIAPRMYIEQLNSYLPSLICPTTLDTTNWSQFIAKVDMTDLNQVHTVVPPRGEPIQWLETLRQQCLLNSSKSFLQRCRDLKKVDMISIGPNCFAWAPLEKQKRQEYYARRRTQSPVKPTSAGSTSMVFLGSSRQASLLSEPTPLPTPPPPPLQPLEEVILRCYWEGLGAELDDVAESFPETLTKIVIQGPRAQFAVPDHGMLPIPKAIGETWTESLPRLRKLALFKLEETFRLAPLLLARCPALEELRVQDRAITYNCDQVLSFGVPRQYPATTTFSEPATSRLKSIDLRGWSALCFHPETLRHTRELETLYLITDCDRFMRNFIPEPGVLLSYDYPSLHEEAEAIRTAMAAFSLSQLDDDDDDDEFNSNYNNNNGEQGAESRLAILRRPCWAWDWDLPNLTKLRLSSEFAYRFQFRMLAGCPQLEYLDLCIAVQMDHTPDITEEQLTGPRDHYYYTHKRVLTKSDFLKTSTSDRYKEDEYISCPKLTSLHLSGRWSMTDEFLTFLFTTVMPNLTDVTESQCLTFSFWGWVRGTSQLKNLKTASSGRKLPEETLVRLGMTKFMQDYRTAPQYIAYEKIVDGEEQVTFVHVPGSDGIKHPRPNGVYSLNMNSKYVLVDKH
ncbi:MAG: hypothetical protein J3R72DRAFT_436138 [Linnemannia gamsii]|nr:MAG: hypothetical protein J3R72DRAFT_436138 [Linnemannia gamsii]